ncbi:MAG: hypothetical protein ABJC09_10755 [Terriglobia bacterium]
MTRFVRTVVLALAALGAGICQQDGAAPQAAPASNIFSGIVTVLTPDSVTVVRKVPAKADVTRTFMRDAQTKVEGRAIKVKSRVTVRYQVLEEGNYQALNIIVR